MTDYKIFDVSLPDSYIEELTEEELDVLIDEGREEHVRLEKIIDKLMWEHTPQLTEEGEPINKVWPSEFSYLPVLYMDEIAEDPGMERKLAEADQISQEVGRVLAVIGSAKTQKATLAALEARIERVKQDIDENGF